MSNRYSLIALGISIVLGAFATPAIAQTDPGVIAEIAGRKVTADELEHKQAGKLLQAKYKYYVAERDALDQFIDDQLLEMQAKKEGVTLDELFKRHIAANVPEPTEDQLRFYYEGVQTDESYEAWRSNIIETVRQLRTKKAKEAYLTQLRGEYGVVIELSQPSAHVEVGNAPRIGAADAPVQIIEFADYECPFCQKVNDDITRLRTQFGNRVSLVYKDFPLPMHPFAEKAAEAAHCAGAQGKFLGISRYFAANQTASTIRLEAAGYRIEARHRPFRSMPRWRGTSANGKDRWYGRQAAWAPRHA